MNLFLAAFSDSGAEAFLPASEAHHCLRVLRLKPGDEIWITDGKGRAAKGILADTRNHSCMVKITGEAALAGRLPYHLHIGIAPTKSTDRMEWFVEKAVELGISEITPVICKNSERVRINTGRLNKTALSAMKQSLRAWLPSIHSPVEFDSFISNVSGNLKLICNQQAPHSCSQLMAGHTNLTVLIGPEGDFTDSEIRQAAHHGFQAAHLGRSRLRTETAAVYICALLRQSFS